MSLTYSANILIITTMKIVFATNNKNKLSEIRDMLKGSDIEILSLEDIGCTDDIKETGKTLEENALIKALHVYFKYKIDCFADDTGLEVSALGGEPGVRSARYAGGEGHDSEANMARLLGRLSGKADRRARFRTVIALATKSGLPESLLKEPDPDDKISNAGPAAATLFFEGVVNGEIIREKRGAGGFGYDPIFMPEGYDKTFAELGAAVKNRISHRAKAVAALTEYLTQGGNSR